MINNTEGCLELMAAIINPKAYLKPGGRRGRSEETLPELGEEWAELAAGLLDIDEGVVKEQLGLQRENHRNRSCV